MAESPPPAGLDVHDVCFAIGGNEILRGVSIEAAPGRTTAILGPSGCGKTTLLRVIAGLERPDSGRVRFAGADVTGVPPHRRGFGMMFQDFALFPHLTVEGNIGFGLRHSGLSRADRRRRVAELLELASLAGYERRTPESLSGGERQRVALARALAPAPRLLMLDEPLGSLDRTLRERLLLELRSILVRLRVPTVYVTHDQLEAFAVADRIVIMDAGRIVRQGTPTEIHGRPGSVFVARFLGMDNIVDGVTTAPGAVVTPVGEWPIGGAEARQPVTVLLRSEGVMLVPRPGDGIVSGVVASRLFQGARTRVQLATAAGPLEFDLPGDGPIPREGESVHVRVAHVQLLEAGG